MASSNNEVFHDSPKSYNSSLSSDEKMFERMCKRHQMLFATSMVGTNTWEFFNANELDLSVEQLINQDVSV
jgi:hypothetical protein